MLELALLRYELDEVTEHLQNPSKLVLPNSGLHEEEFEVYMGHIYAHLNRIWNSRNHVGEIDNKLWEKFTRFPLDIKLCG